MFFFLLVNLLQIRVIQEEETPIEKMSSKHWPVGMQTLSANHWTKPGDPNGRDRTEGDEVECNTIEEQ